MTVTDRRRPAFGGEDPRTTRHAPQERDAHLRSLLAIRVLCHAAVELPLVAICLADIAVGWRPLFDNAATAWRSYLVFTSSSPLVGHLIAGPFVAYGPGPLQYWLLAVPVRIDPGHGLLWGAMLFTVLAVALAIEAAWSAARRLGAVATSLAILVLFVTQPQILLDPPWNASFAAIWFVTTLASAWAVASGRLRWWPVTVLAASIAAQCHEFLFVQAVAVCVGSAAVGLFGELSGGGRRSRWLLYGIAVAVAAWLAPLVQQFTNHPGNLTLLWRAAHRHVATLGMSKALGTIAAITRPYPQWFHSAPQSNGLQSLAYAFSSFSGASWWGIVVLVLLVLIALVSWSTGRRTLAGLAAVAFIASISLVVVVAGYPSAQVVNFEYFGGFLFPVGMVVWLTLLWAIVELIRGLFTRLELVLPGRIERARPALPVAVGALVIAVSSLAVVSASPLVAEGVGAATGLPRVLPEVRATAASADAVARVAPERSFNLNVQAPSILDEFGMDLGIDYLLRTRDFRPRLRGIALLDIGGDARGVPGLPTVLVRYSPRPAGSSGSGVSVVVSGGHR